MVKHRSPAEADAARGTRWLALLVRVLICWLVGAGIVRFGLNWADTFPYSPASELRYLAIAVLALTVAVTGTVLSIRRFRLSGRRPD
ncbi:hypothetical protein [Leucobacter sp. M11]|uniref:hypothetical protein n=1 Tax=Leucobacter sp. M11 TaxID=2993565 RepID=UPI002D7ED66B|nr:hypothetical protein [Leucobacter sp. M11]MEB4613646.1 hypothetical protein [Leucobacter sp. M11]